jgi:Domain of unknown function (DU1801)
MGDGPTIEPEAQAFIDAIPAEQRPLFDRMDGVIRAVHPDVDVGLSYKMPTYRVGERSLHVGVWKHGISLYGWNEGRDGGLIARHPELSSGKGTLRITPAVANDISDDELRDLVEGSLGT